MIKNDIAILSREFLKKHNIIRYRMKKISEMNDQEAITACHWYCEENNLIGFWLYMYRETNASIANIKTSTIPQIISVKYSFFFF